MNDISDIKTICDKFINDTTCVYKLCGKEWLIILEKIQGDDINNNTITNETRGDIIDSSYAKFRADKLKVMLIISINDLTKTLNQLCNTFVDNMETPHIIKYTLNKIVKSDFDKNIDLIYTTGIHYFKTIDAALYYREIPSNYSGFWIYWYDNGQKMAEGNYIDGMQMGKWILWIEKNKINMINKIEGYYVDGIILMEIII